VIASSDRPTWDELAAGDHIALGTEMHGLMARLFPICRSITGDGVRKTHAILREWFALESYEVPSGTRVFDWTIPREWNIRDAYLLDPLGREVCRFRDSNLHVLNYSVPIRSRMSLSDLLPHLYTLPDQPDVIPYMTSYYNDNWGFCLPHRRLDELIEGEYEAVIDSTLEDGHLTYGEYCIEGATPDEVVISCYTCHPSLCNDNLSGVVLAAALARELSRLRDSLRYTYRFLFVPETIGAITWLCRNEDRIGRIKHGLVATCLGDPGCSTYKKSRRGNAEVDRATLHVLKHSGQKYEVLDFFPAGSDERQYCSPAFDLPFGSLMRTPYGRFPEYHTSADHLEFVRPECLADTLTKYIRVIDIIDKNNSYMNLNPKCEPQLGSRGLYGPIGGQKARKPDQMALRWVLNYSDGLHSLLDIADRADMEFAQIHDAARVLAGHDLLREVTRDDHGERRV
jgi:aminopeptidase-like protein